MSKPSYQQPEQQSLGESAGGKKADVKSARLLAEREKFAQHVMVSAGVCFGGKWQLHFVDESANVDSVYYVGRLLPSLVDDCTRLLVAQWIHLPARRRASTHSSCHAELATNQLPRFHCQRLVASKFTRLEPLGLPCLGGNVEGLSQAPSETENDRRTGGSPAGDLGQPT